MYDKKPADEVIKCLDYAQEYCKYAWTREEFGAVAKRIADLYSQVSRDYVHQHHEDDDFPLVLSGDRPMKEVCYSSYWSM